MRRLLWLLPAALFMGGAQAEITDSNPVGFTTVNETTIAARRDAVWRAAIAEVGQWWSSDHTIAGDASRLSITAKPQGCFCEALNGEAGVVHMTITMVNPGVILRLTGGLGPLGLLGVDGNMTWEFEETDTATSVRFTYAVGGYRPGGLDEVAEAVDYVVNEALQRLKAHVETGNAEDAVIE